MFYILNNQDEYDVPKEDHVFSINGKVYQGFTYVADKSTPAYEMLKCGHNFLTVFREYIKGLEKNELPTAKLFIIDNQQVNAFAVYEESLSSYCIGVFMGACVKIFDNVQKSFSKLIGDLIPEDQSDVYLDLIYTEAIRFFVAHEYSHILAGHVDDPKYIQLEYSEMHDGKTEDNLFSQMKEFQVDQMAVQAMCYMAHWNLTTETRIEGERARKECIKKYHRTVPAPVLAAMAIQAKENKIRDLKPQFDSKLFTELSFITAGINVIFYTFDVNRKKVMEDYAKAKKLSIETVNSFAFKSGLLTLREFDHPLPAMRIDAVTRIIDECIEQFVPSDEVDYWCFQVSRYSWEVEIVRNDYDLGKLYRHIAYTPIAQDFIQEIEDLWQQKKNSFKAYLKPLERLYYANRIVHMTNDGELINSEEQ